MALLIANIHPAMVCPLLVASHHEIDETVRVKDGSLAEDAILRPNATEMVYGWAIVAVAAAAAVVVVVQI